MVKKYLLDVGHVPFAPNGAHDLQVEWLVAAMKRGAEAQPPSETYNELGRETVI